MTFLYSHENLHNPDDLSVGGITVLHQAVNSGEIDKIKDAVEKLIQNEENINPQDTRGHTPLHYEVLKGQFANTEIIKLLLDNGADLSIKDKYGQTPYACATTHMVRTALQRASES